MTPILTCTLCRTPLERDDRFCVHCGQTTALILWSSSLDMQPGDGIVALSPGGTFYLVAHNTGGDAVHVRVDTARLRGLRPVGNTEGTDGPVVDSYSSLAFALEHVPGEDISGYVSLFSADGLRSRPSAREPHNPWWEPRAERSAQRPARELVRIVEDRWIIGSPNLLFPPGVRKQYLHVWNDAEQERSFDSEVPEGYRISNFAVLLDKKPPLLFASGEMELTVEVEPERRVADREWPAGPESQTVPIRRLEAAFGEMGADAVIAIDFGTRNTGVRVRWRHGIVPGKPKGTVDVVGDRDGNARFPTEMALHRSGRSFRWGAEVPRGILPADEIRIENLKTLLRVNEEPYTQENPRWTNEHLLERYFEQLFFHIDEYFRKADADTPLSRRNLNLHYVLTRPVLDANEGDAQGQDYELALMIALERCGVTEEQITFVREPVAAAIGLAKRREEEILALGEGTAIAVVDAGGGTTDVALARVSLRGGRLALDIRGSYALNLDAANPALSAVQRFGTGDRREVGGNVLDYALTQRLLTDAVALLETEGRPVPPRLEVSATPISPEEKQQRESELVVSCRTMKEDFAYVSTHYLNSATNQPARKHGTSIFANRPDYEGITLEHSLFGKHVIAPILRTPVQELRGRMEQDAYEEQGIRPSQVKQVFYVGGTNVDFYVREQFQEAFPNSTRLKAESGEDVEERISERLNAVIEGAVWYGEALFAASPLTLALGLNGEEKPLLQAGDPLPPEDAREMKPFPVRLEPFQELEATLTATGGGLSEAVCVARGFYRNTSETMQEGMLQVQISREKGVTAHLNINRRPYKQWQFALVEAV